MDKDLSGRIFVGMLCYLQPTEVCLPPTTYNLGRGQLFWGALQTQRLKFLCYLSDLRRKLRFETNVAHCGKRGGWVFVVYSCILPPNYGVIGPYLAKILPFCNLRRKWRIVTIVADCVKCGVWVGTCCWSMTPTTKLFQNRTIFLNVMDIWIFHVETFPPRRSPADHLCHVITCDANMSCRLTDWLDLVFLDSAVSTLRSFDSLTLHATSSPIDVTITIQNMTPADVSVGAQ